MAEQKPCYATFYSAADAFLWQQGFDASKREIGKSDGNWARSFIQSLKNSACAIGGSCAEQSVTMLLQYMEVHCHPWNRAHSVEALKLASLPERLLPK